MTAFDFLQWTLSGFWRSIGLILMIGALGGGIGSVVKAVRK